MPDGYKPEGHKPKELNMITKTEEEEAEPGSPTSQLDPQDEATKEAAAQKYSSLSSAARKVTLEKTTVEDSDSLKGDKSREASASRSWLQRIRPRRSSLERTRSRKSSLDIARSRKSSLDIARSRKSSLDIARSRKSSLDIARSRKSSLDIARSRKSSLDIARSRKSSFEMSRLRGPTLEMNMFVTDTSRKSPRSSIASEGAIARSSTLEPRRFSTQQPGAARSEMRMSMQPEEQEAAAQEGRPSGQVSSERPHAGSITQYFRVIEKQRKEMRLEEKKEKSMAELEAAEGASHTSKSAQDPDKNIRHIKCCCCLSLRVGSLLTCVLCMVGDVLLVVAGARFFDDTTPLRAHVVGVVVILLGIIDTVVSGVALAGVLLRRGSLLCLFVYTRVFFLLLWLLLVMMFLLESMDMGRGLVLACGAFMLAAIAYCTFEVVFLYLRFIYNVDDDVILIKALTDQDEPDDATDAELIAAVTAMTYMELTQQRSRGDASTEQRSAGEDEGPGGGEGEGLGAGEGAREENS